ncbi:hypothetical protein HYN69_00425 [Gemmobacter aquarius]|uniref:Uncharacterized protein n=1 Tax=Paragemmobacter aquarius TaxID=2169400 RepID=A0A2S0UHA7_9RHOB|nr:hypothetical protein HYN69_00425 [Gemmobacter aquarius]
MVKFGLSNPSLPSIAELPMRKSPVAGVPLALKIRPSIVIEAVSSDRPSLAQTAIQRPSDSAVITGGVSHGVWVTSVLPPSISAVEKMVAPVGDSTV